MLKATVKIKTIKNDSIKRKERIKNIDIELDNWRNLKSNSEKMISIVNKTLKKIDVNFEETRYGRIRVNSLDA